jgi:hypothetical protein
VAYIHKVPARPREHERRLGVTLSPNVPGTLGTYEAGKVTS